MEEETKAPTKSAASTARARAEARRRRILEQSQNRIDQVSGLSGAKAPEPAPTPEVSEEKGEEKVDAALDSTTTGGSGESEDAVTKEDSAPAATPAPAPALTGAQKLAQARRRRYKKNAATATKQEPQATTPVVSMTTSAESDTSKPDSETETTTTTTTKTEEKEAPKMEEKKEEASKKVEVTAQTTDTTTSTERKYQGVAKFRRKRNAEKKAEAATATPTVTSQSPSINQKEKKQKVISLTPILFQFMTVICLFLAGFDIGIQNHVHSRQYVPQKYHKLSIVEHGIAGLSLVGLNPKTKTTSTLEESPSFAQNTLADELEAFETILEEEEDEFQTMTTKQTPQGAESSTNTPNIDPIFQADLDALTLGKPGVLMAAARMAISFHRKLTYLLLTLPVSIVKGLYSMPARLLSNPPVLFLCAVLIRIVGKYLLGGTIPDLDAVLDSTLASAAGTGELGDDQGENGKKKDPSDLLNMGREWVKNMVKNYFPNVVLAFSILKQARADMFVVLCGLFVGLIMPVGMMSRIPIDSVGDDVTDGTFAEL